MPRQFLSTRRCATVTEHTDDTTVENTTAGGTSLSVVAALASVALALYYYYLRGEKQRGQFVGLWPATILGLAIYRKLDKLQQSGE
jgi:uncharacterized membrane protein YfcA